MLKKSLGWLWHLGGFLVKETRAWLGFLAGYLQTGEQIVFRWIAPGAAQSGRVAVFVHFDRQGRVNRFVLGYLEALRAAGCEIVFVTNSGRLQPEALVALQPLCRVILVRRNVGYDFAAMRDGLAAIAAPAAAIEMVLIANDSVYGPFAPIGPLLDRIDFSAADIWGGTESWQRRYHLQSFFVAVGPAVLASPAWSAFWAQVRPVRSKHWVVTRYEVGLTQSLLRAGMRARALFPYQDLAQRVDKDLLGPDSSVVDPFLNVRRIHAGRIRFANSARWPLNPTAELWRQLLEAGFPFIKRELLRDNPAGIADIVDWREVLHRQFGTDVAIIEEDLQRVLKNTSP